jgi:hypothetical protein
LHCTFYPVASHFALPLRRCAVPSRQLRDPGHSGIPTTTVPVVDLSMASYVRYNVARCQMSCMASYACASALCPHTWNGARSDRSVRPCIDGCQYMPQPVHCGVAQGCPLSPFLYATFIDGLLDSVYSECADCGLLAGASPTVLQAYADDKVAASTSTLGLQRILHAMKRYGDTWGCCANTDKSHVLLVGPPGAVAEARNHDFCWGSAPLQVVDQVKYLGVRLKCAWTWDMHIAAAYRKSLGASHT